MTMAGVNHVMGITAQTERERIKVISFMVVAKMEY
jgi:hypothetical protein